MVGRDGGRRRPEVKARGRVFVPAKGAGAIPDRRRRARPWRKLINARHGGGGWIGTRGLVVLGVLLACGCRLAAADGHRRKRPRRCPRLALGAAGVTRESAPGPPAAPGPRGGK